MRFDQKQLVEETCGTKRKRNFIEIESNRMRGRKESVSLIYAERPYNHIKSNAVECQLPKKESGWVGVSWVSNR